jgi:RNA polymerase sigma-70 factor (ECF subfamily)
VPDERTSNTNAASAGIAPIALHLPGHPRPRADARPDATGAGHVHDAIRRRRTRPIDRAAGGGVSGPGISPDRELAQRLRAGDEHALREVYRAHASAALGLATRVLGSPIDAEDVLQEVFVRLWEHPDVFDPQRGRLRSYLLAMTHSRAVERLRAEESQRRRADAAQREPAGRAEPDPVRDLTARDAGAAVRRALAALPPEQREPIEMAYFGGLSYREVAAALGDPEGTVRYRIRAGMQKMRAALQAEEVSP